MTSRFAKLLLDRTSRQTIHNVLDARDRKVALEKPASETKTGEPAPVHVSAIDEEPPFG